MPFSVARTASLRPAVLLAACLSLAAVAACKPSESPADAGLATLTAVALAPSGGGTAPGPDAPAAATGTPLPVAVDPNEPVSEGTARVIAEMTRAAEETVAGIANVDSLVEGLPPLATFTPDPDSVPSGELLYVRNGVFYRGTADGEEIEQVRAGDLPAVWAPPDDPGRAWASPRGDRVAFFGTRDAELWVMRPDGGDARAVAGPSLPTDEHALQVSGLGEGTLRLRPGKDYTLVLDPEAEERVAVLVDNNEQHVRGEGRIRIVNASAAARDPGVTVLLNGTPLRGPIAYGASTGDLGAYVGAQSIEVTDNGGRRLLLMPSVAIGEKQLKTVFLYGDETMQGVEAAYEVSEPQGNEARVRVFNATNAPASVTIDDGAALASNLAPGTLSPYVRVEAAVGLTERSDLELSLYGLRPGEHPVAWSPDGSRIAFLAAADGQIDLFIADIDEDAPRRVTRSTERDLNPVWSPDGESLAWYAIDETLDAHTAYVLPEGASAPVAISLEPVREGIGGTDPVKLPRGPGWVNDGTLFMYPVMDGSVGIWSYDIGAARLRELHAGVITDPVWSAEAGLWAFTQDDTPGTIFTLTPSGQLATLVSGAAGFPMFSPDGRTVSWVEGESTDTTGWILHAVDTDGGNDRALTGKVPLLQESPPVPGPNAKRVWLDGGRLIGFTRVGRDYGLAERGGGYRSDAGTDIENLWVVPADGGAQPKPLTDILKAFYFKEITPSEDGAVGLVAFSYLDRAQQLWAVRERGGEPVHIDGGVRWFMWLP